MKNRLVFKFAEKLQRDIVEEMEKTEAVKEYTDRVSSKIDKLKLDKIVRGNEKNKIKLKKTMLCHLLLGEEAKSGLENEINSNNSKKFPSKIISKVKNLHKIINKGNSLEKIIKKIEISRGVGAEASGFEADSILEELENRTVDSNIQRIAKNYKQMLNMNGEYNDEEYCSRRELNWNFLSRTIYDNECSNDKLKGCPENLLWMNIDIMKKEKNQCGKKLIKNLRL